jgi:hypothetical protein
MARSRYKSQPYRHRQALAFAVFGDIKPLLSNYVLRVWMYDDEDPVCFTCPTLDIVAREKARIIQGDLEAYDAYASTAPQYEHDP